MSFNPHHAGVNMKRSRSRSSWSATANPNRRQSKQITEAEEVGNIAIAKEEFDSDSIYPDPKYAMLTTSIGSLIEHVRCMLRAKLRTDLNLPLLPQTCRQRLQLRELRVGKMVIKWAAQIKRDAQIKWEAQVKTRCRQRLQQRELRVGQMVTEQAA